MSDTILVTGACGFTGSHMIEHLSEHRPEARIIATDLPGSQRSEYYVAAPESDAPQPVYYEDIHSQYDVGFVPADLTNDWDVRRLGAFCEYDTVFHVASLFDYFADRETLYAVNVDGTQNLLSMLAGQGSCRLVHWSTLGVLGDAGFDEPKTELSAYNPHNRYCESKVVQEQVVEAYGDQLDITVIRPAPIYGPRHQYGVYHILTLLERLGFVPVTRLYPRSRQLQFPCVHVTDVVRAATYLVDHPDAIGERYNLLSDPIGQDALLTFLAETLSLRKVTVPTPYHLYAVLANGVYPLFRQSEKVARRRERRPLVDAPMIRYLTANMWFSNQKLKETGFRFVFEDPRDGLEEYVDWCQDNGYLTRQEPSPHVTTEGGTNTGPLARMPQSISLPETVEDVQPHEPGEATESFFRRIIPRVRS